MLSTPTLPPWGLSRNESFDGPPKTDAGYRTVALPPHILPLVAEHLDRYAGPERLFVSKDGLPMRPADAVDLPVIRRGVGTDLGTNNSEQAGGRRQRPAAHRRHNLRKRHSSGSLVTTWDGKGFATEQVVGVDDSPPRASAWSRISGWLRSSKPAPTSGRLSGFATVVVVSLLMATTRGEGADAAPTPQLSSAPLPSALPPSLARSLAGSLSVRLGRGGCLAGGHASGKHLQPPRLGGRHRGQGGSPHRRRMRILR